MILLFNVKITDIRHHRYHRAPWYKADNRTDVFKYCLHSLAELESLITRAIFYVKLSPEVYGRGEEIYGTIFSLFPKAEVYATRNNVSADWRQAWPGILGDSTLDEPVLLCTNDDHIFMDHDIDVISSGLTLLKNDPDPFAVLYYSHWAEQCRWSHYKQGELVDNGDYVKYRDSNTDGIHIIKLSRLFKIFVENDYGDQEIYRSDGFVQRGLIPDIISNFYAPTRKLFDHYDGYSHLVGYSNQLDNIIPPLTIPDGFFENNIKLRLGFDHRQPGWTTLNPAAAFLHAYNNGWADHRLSRDDIPLFWRRRVTDVEIDSAYNDASMYQERDLNFIAQTRCVNSCFGIHFSHTQYPPLEWYKKHMRCGT